MNDEMRSRRLRNIKHHTLRRSKKVRPSENDHYAYGSCNCHNDIEKFFDEEPIGKESTLDERTPLEKHIDENVKVFINKWNESFPDYPADEEDIQVTVQECDKSTGQTCYTIQYTKQDPDYDSYMSRRETYYYVPERKITRVDVEGLNKESAVKKSIFETIFGKESIFETIFGKDAVDKLHSANKITESMKKEAPEIAVSAAPITKEEKIDKKLADHFSNTYGPIFDEFKTEILLTFDEETEAAYNRLVKLNGEFRDITNAEDFCQIYEAAFIRYFDKHMNKLRNLLNYELERYND